MLTADRIVDAAIELIEREGVDSFSMRRVAAELDAGVMSLYNHLPNKAALLDAVGGRLLGGIELADDPTADWADRARALVRALRAVSLRYPRCTMLMVTRELNSPAALRPVEHALEMLHTAGFDGEIAVRVVRVFIAYTFGALLREVGATPMVGQPTKPVTDVDLLDPAEFPEITGLAKPLSEFDHDVEFEFGLELLIRTVTSLAETPQSERPS